MDLAQILIDLLDKPDIPRPYRELQKYYANANRSEEAAAIASLLERKFEKKNEITTDGSHSN
jgi:hypothetical protein